MRRKRAGGDGFQPLNTKEEIDVFDGYDAQRMFWAPKPTPFHLAAKRGYLPVYQQMMENANDKNPKDGIRVTPLHKPAENGHLSICQLIVENVDDKNPKNDFGSTPLHEAAEQGHFLVCQFLESVINKEG